METRAGAETSPAMGVAAGADSERALYRFAGFELDAAAFELRRADRVVPLQPKVFDLLHYLVRSGARVVSKRELFDAVWPGEVVTETALTHALMNARRALGDDGTRQDLIRTVRGRGYRFVPEVRIEREPPSAQDAAGAVFVGRHRELARLYALVDGAVAGRGCFVAVGGEPGIGKTALAERVAARALERGVTVFRSRCHEGQDAPAYRPWLDLVRTYLRSGDRDRVLSEMGPGAADLAQVLPEIRDWIEDWQPPPRLADGDGRFRLFDSLTQFAHNATRRGPILALVEDLQWADASSVALLCYLAREVGDLSALIIGTYRDLPPRAEQPLARALAELSTVPSFEKVELAGLDAAEVRELVTGIEGATPPGSLVESLVDRTQGNPFFVREMLRHWRELGVVNPAMSGWIDAGAERPGLPDGVRAVMRQRLARLSAACCETLRLASALGEEFALKVIERASDLPPEEVRRALDEALLGREIREVEGAPGRYAFTHALIREALYQDLPPHRRRELHRWIGKTLEELYGSDRDAHVAELARHFTEASPLGEADHAVEYLVRAAVQAIDEVAFEEAAVHYARALELADLCEALSPLDRFELLLALEETQRFALDYSAARETAARTGRLAREVGDARMLARAALARSRRLAPFESRVVDPLERELLEEGVRAQADRSGEIAAGLQAALALALYWTPDTDRCRRIADRAVMAARAAGGAGSGALAHALFARYVAQLRPRVRDAPLDQLEALIGAARSAGDVQLVTLCHYLRATEHMMRGDLAAADGEIQILAERALAERSPKAPPLLPGLRAGAAFREGRLDEAETLALESQRLMERVRPGSARLICTGRLFEIRRQQGRLDELVDSLRPFARRADELPGWWDAALALALCHAGRETEARRLYDALIPGYMADAGRSYTWLTEAGRMVELIGRFGDVERAGALYERLKLHAGFHAATLFSSVYIGPVDAELGRLAVSLGRLDVGLAHLERALSITERLRLHTWQARIQLDCGRAALRRGRGGDRERALRDAGQAAAIGRRLGLGRLAADADALRGRASG